MLVPIKAIVLNLLSLTATFGIMVWVFQDGNVAGCSGFTATGLTDISTPILMFCVAFGLSMDYEVFLLSRIKEEYDRTGDNDLAVAIGLERTGRIVTAAALLLSIRSSPSPPPGSRSSSCSASDSPWLCSSMRSSCGRRWCRR